MFLYDVSPIRYLLVDNRDRIFELDTGRVEDSIRIPPEKPTFFQIVDILDQSPAVRGRGSDLVQVAGGAYALLYFRSYMGYLSSLVYSDNPKLGQEDVSLISNDEMKRINIEISHDLAWLLAERSQNERRVHNLLVKVYAYFYHPLSVSKRQVESRSLTDGMDNTMRIVLKTR